MSVFRICNLGPIGETQVLLHDQFPEYKPQHAKFNYTQSHTRVRSVSRAMQKPQPESRHSTLVVGFHRTRSIPGGLKCEDSANSCYDFNTISQVLENYQFLRVNDPACVGYATALFSPTASTIISKRYGRCGPVALNLDNATDAKSTLEGWLHSRKKNRPPGTVTRNMLGMSLTPWSYKTVCFIQLHGLCGNSFGADQH